MRSLKNRVAIAAIFALIFATTPGLVVAGDAGSRIEGMVIAADGKPAAGYSVHLIESNGEASRTAETDSDGIYTFGGLESGDYALGIQTPGGEAAAVAAPPVAVQGQELARRDIRLYNSNSQLNSAPVNYSGGMGLWWAGLSAGAKAGTIIALLAVVGYGTSELLDDDDEPVASPSGTLN